MSKPGHMINSLLEPSLSAVRAEILGRNLWRIGLSVQQHRIRIEKEMKIIDENNKRILKISARMRSSNRRKHRKK